KAGHGYVGPVMGQGAARDDLEERPAFVPPAGQVTPPGRRGACPEDGHQDRVGSAGNEPPDNLVAVSLVAVNGAVIGKRISHASIASQPRRSRAPSALLPLPCLTGRPVP